MRHKLWVILIFIFALITALAGTVLSACPQKDGQIYFAKDYFDPLESILKSIAPDKLAPRNSYELGHKLTGLNGMAFIYSSQVESYTSDKNFLGFTPLYEATVVIAIKRYSDVTRNITGWQSLMQSKAKVSFPHNGTEGGRLAAIAMSKGLGASEGDIKPAVEALAVLQNENRLNSRNVYTNPTYIYSYDPELVKLYDAIILWDYQAIKLSMEDPDKWDIIYPEEGIFSIPCGFVTNQNAKSESLNNLASYLVSEDGQNALLNAGFHTITKNTELRNWKYARLSFNPKFRRSVLSIRKYSPASVFERLLLKSIVLLLFVFMAQRIFRHTPKNQARWGNLHGMFFTALWLVLGIGKTLSLDPDVSRYLWFATYVPRHFLPIFWYFMCYSYRYDSPPKKRVILGLIIPASLLSLFVLSNDLHRQVFHYLYTDSLTWIDYYTNNWGYFLSVVWSFLPAFVGIFHILRNEDSLKRKRQFLYSGFFFGLLLVYQFAYIAGIVQVTELDVPTTIAIFFLIFIFAAQRERFLGAFLLNRPVFHNSLYGIVIYDKESNPVFLNKTMKTIDLFSKGDYKLHKYDIQGGTAFVYEDISALKAFEKALKKTHEKLLIAKSTLTEQVEQTEETESRMEQGEFSSKMEELFYGKIDDIKLFLKKEITGSDIGKPSLNKLRFLLSICQHRLRFILKYPKNEKLVPASLITDYVKGIIAGGSRLGLDAVLVDNSKAYISRKQATVILEHIDTICLRALELIGSSLVLRFSAKEEELSLIGILSEEGREEDMAIRLVFPERGDRYDLV